MKDIAKIFAYLVAVIALGALLAPPLYWAAQWLATHDPLRPLANPNFEKIDHKVMIAALLLLWPIIRWLRLKGWRSSGLGPRASRFHLLVWVLITAIGVYFGARWMATHGILQLLAQFKFQKYFNRAALIAALALLWPTIRWLQVKGWRDLGLEPDARWGRHFLVGFIIAAAGVGLMAFGYIQFGVYRFRPDSPWQKLPMIALSAITVAILEEALFRGGILGLVRRSMSPYAALFWVSTLFAIVHFLKPDEDFDPGLITWLSGFVLIPHAFHQFAEPQALLAGFTTLFALGWLCGDARLRTRSLWMGIGLHAGIVFVKMSFSVLSKRREVHLPWIGRELQLGLVPVGILILGWVVVVLYTNWEKRRGPTP